MTLNKAVNILLVAAFIMIVFNSYQISNLADVVGSISVGPEGSQTAASVSPVSKVIPAGVPSVYGAELDISYDDVNPNDPRMADLAIRKLGELDVSLQLNSAEKERYINILYRLNNGISCEYCCGARSVIFENGEPACGCAHSYAMRGLAKYLIINHGNEYSDEQILEEVGKWKVLFFPTILEQKAAVMESKGIEVNYATLASNQYRGIEKGQAGGGMVGGC